MGRKCYQIALKEDRLGKKDNLWVEKFISFGKSKQIGQKQICSKFLGRKYIRKVTQTICSKLKHNTIMTLNSLKVLPRLMPSDIFNIYYQDEITQ